MNEQAPAIVFRDVWKSYPSYNHITGGIKSFLFHLPKAIQELRQRRTALEGINFEIPRGTKFGFVGRNGAGKSTTLGLIAGVLSPDRGEINVNGRVSPLLELGAGFHPEMTGRENIMLNGVLLGLTKAEVLEYQDEIIEFSELGEFIEQPVRTYSSGMYAKLGFAVVSILKPDILLLDEILSVGDEAFKRKCDAKFEEFLSDRNVTIVLVSHALESVSQVCEQAAWIENKQVRMVGPAADVVKEYRTSVNPKVVVEETIEASVKKPALFLDRNIVSALPHPEKQRCIYLIRHGLSVGNEKKLATATTKDPLSPAGRKQAIAAGAWLKKNGISFSRCYVSQWRRAQETAKLFLPDGEFIEDTRLGEMNLGEDSTRSFSGEKETLPSAYDHIFPGGESRRQLFERCASWLDEMTDTMLPGENVLAVTHAGPIECLTQYISGVDPSFLPVFYPKNASVTKFVYYDSQNLFGSRQGWMLEIFSFVPYQMESLA